MQTPAPKTFSQWLENHADKDTPVGYMAREWIATARCEQWKGEACADFLLGGLWGSAPHAECVATAAQALASYSAYLKRWAARQS